MDPDCGRAKASDPPTPTDPPLEGWSRLGDLDFEGEGLRKPISGTLPGGATGLKGMVFLHSRAAKPPIFNFFQSRMEWSCPGSSGSSPASCQQTSLSAYRPRLVAPESPRKWFNEFVHSFWGYEIHKHVHRPAGFNGNCGFSCSVRLRKPIFATLLLIWLPLFSTHSNIIARALKSLSCLASFSFHALRRVSRPAEFTSIT